MGSASQDCPERNNLEIYIRTLMNVLHGHTERLMKLVGKDHTQFMAAKASCSKTHVKILESKTRLLAHRVAHGC